MIREISKNEEKKYSHIPLGNEEGSGECIGIGKTFGYFGCANCWKKVEIEANFFGACSASTDTRTMEFSTELYV